MKLGMKFLVVIVYNHVFNPRGCLKTMVLVATEVESNYKISKIIDIFCAILNIWVVEHRFLCFLMKKQDKVELLSSN